MEITELVEKNSTLLRLGLHLEFNDARHRVAAHFQRNIDRSEYYFPNDLKLILKRLEKHMKKSLKLKIKKNLEIKTKLRQNLGIKNIVYR